MLLKGFIDNNLIWVCQQWTALSAQSCHSLGMNFSEANNRNRPEAALRNGLLNPFGFVILSHDIAGLSTPRPSC